MTKKNISFLIVFILLMQMPNIATSQSRISAWGEVTRDYSLVVTSDEQYPAISWLLAASIGHSVNGKKRIYIALRKFISGNPMSICEDEEQVFAKINGQAIRFHSFCRDYEKNGKVYKETYMTPLSDKGDRYLYNSFKKSRDHITFELWSINTPISSVGFSSAWESFGGDAL